MFIAAFNVIGIAVRTSNQNGQSMQDIPALWARFESEGIFNKIPHKIEHQVYGIYTDYEGDYTMSYTAIIGCKVSSLDEIPEGMVGKVIGGGEYQTFTAKGSIQQGAVFHEWVKIWNANIDRAYTSDFEVYGAKAADMENAEVDIMIAVK